MATSLGLGAVCPCGSGRPFGACCEPLLSGQRSAATPRELMRSRYTAHVVGDEAYLQRTSAANPRRPRPAVAGSGPAVTWISLVIHRDESGPSAEIGYVEFSAHYRDTAGEHVMRERSEFRRSAGQWIYVRGVAAPEAEG